MCIYIIYICILYTYIGLIYTRADGRIGEKVHTSTCVLCLLKDSRRTAVMAAAASGSAKVLKAILDAGGKVNEIMSKGKFHALHEAAKSGCFECMKVIITSYNSLFQ